MPIQLICPNLRCRKLLSVPDDARAKMVKCQYCHQQFRVPAPARPGASTAAPAAPKTASH
jgi:hypothetical protein